MTSRAEATAAPITFKSNGKELRLSPLEDRDFGEFERFLQDKYVEVAKRNLSGLEPSVQIELLKDVINTAAGITITSTRGQELMQSVESIVKFVWLHCRKHQPELSETELFTWLEDDEVHKQILDKIESLNTPHNGSATVKKKKRIKKRIPTKRQKT